MPIYILTEDNKELNKQRFHLSKKAKEQVNANIATMEAQGLEKSNGYKLLKRLSDEEYNPGKEKKDKRAVKNPNIHTEGDIENKPEQGIMNKTVEGGIHDNKVSKDKTFHQFTDFLYGNSGELTQKHKSKQAVLNHQASKPLQPSKPKKLTEPKELKPIKTDNGEIYVKEGKRKFKITESQLQRLVEYHQQLEIPFEGENGDPYARPNYQHYIDFLESIGSYGTLNSCQMTVSYAFNACFEGALDSFINENGDEDPDYDDEFIERHRDDRDMFKDYVFEDEEEPTIFDLTDYGRQIYRKETKDYMIQNLEKEDFYQYVNTHAKDTKLWVERMITIPNHILSNMKMKDHDNFYDYLRGEYGGVGVCWTWEKGNSMAYNAERFHNDKGENVGSTALVIKGWVNVDEINWEETIMLNAYGLNYEREIRTDYDAKVEIVEITTKTGKTLPLNNHIIVPVD